MNTQSILDAEAQVSDCVTLYYEACSGKRMNALLTCYSTRFARSSPIGEKKQNYIGY